MQKIEDIFNIFIQNYPNLGLQLASGGLYDAKGVGTSDVDILYICDNPELGKDIFNNIYDIDFEGDRYIYKIGGFEREVNIYASSNIKYKISLIHRQNEITLNGFELLSAQAIILKQYMGTEPARAKVLGLDGDPYEQISRSDLYNIAIDRENKLKTYIKSLPK